MEHHKDTERVGNYDAAVWHSHSTKWPSLCPQWEAPSAVMEPKREEMKTENWMFLLWLKQNRHEGPLATKGQRGQPASPNKCHIPLRAGDEACPDWQRMDWLEGSDLDQHLQQTPFTLCALTAAIILPRAAIVSFLWMSQHQSPDYPKSDVTRNHNEGLNYLSYLFTNWNWNLMNFKNMLLGEKVILLSWCIWICTCKLCLQRVYLLLKLLGDWVCALCVCPENSVLHISRFGVWLPLILFVVGFKQICRLHVLLFY